MEDIKKANKTFKDKTIKSEMKNTLNKADTLKRLFKWLIIKRRGSPYHQLSEKCKLSSK